MSQSELSDLQLQAIVIIKKLTDNMKEFVDNPMNTPMDDDLMETVAQEACNYLKHYDIAERDVFKNEDAVKFLMSVAD